MVVDCSYEDCSLQFKTREAMIQHKIKDPEHEYCKRCNVDCEDCEDYLIHQMQSSNHIACPMCGVEFKSASGRDSHFEQSHRRQQNIQCPGLGCGQKFSKAAQLMSHIENDECEKITLEQFSRQRAEKQIQKDFWHTTLQPDDGFSKPTNVASDGDTKSGGGVTLLDNDDRRGNGRSQLDTPDVAGQTPLHPIFSGHYTKRRPTDAFQALSLDERYPALPSQQPTSQTNMNLPDGTDLMNLEVPAENQSRHGPVAGAWRGGSIADQSHFSTYNPSTSLGFGQGGPQSMFGQLDPGTSIPDGLSQFQERARNPHAHVKTKGPSYLRSGFDPNRYYDPIQVAFICPGIKCNGKFNSPEAFTAHLTTGAHAGGRTTCPSCLGKFGSTTALVAHCESGSRKCNIRKSANYNQVMRELTGGLIGTAGFYDDGTEKYVATKQQKW